MATKRRSAKTEDGEELRGFVVKLYPTQEQSKLFYEVQKEMREGWNYLVEQHRAVTGRAIMQAVSDGVTPALPPKPEKGAKREEWRAYNKALITATIAAHKHVKGMEEFAWPKLSMRAECYQPLIASVREKLGREVIAPISAFRAVITRFMAARVPKKTAAGPWRPPRFKREVPPWLDHTMIQVRDGNPLKFDEAGCWLKIFKTVIRARGGTAAPGSAIGVRAARSFPATAQIAGCSIVRRADGWYCSIRVKTKPRQLERPTKGPIGVCFGLNRLMTTSDGVWVENCRGNEYSKLVAWRDEEIGRLRKVGLENEAFDLSMVQRRYMLKYSRKVREDIYTRVLPALSKHEKIVIGIMARDDVQGEMCRLGEDDDGGVVSAAGMVKDLIKQRYGERVAEVAVPAVEDGLGEVTARKVLDKWLELRA